MLASFYLLPSLRMKLTGILKSAPGGYETWSVTLGCWSLAQAQKGNSCRFLESGLWKTLERIWCLERPWVFLDRLYEWISKNHAGKEWEEWGVENRHHRQIQGTPGASGRKGIFAFGERYDLGTSVCVCTPMVGSWQEHAFLGNLA